ncbi:MAG: Maf family protein [Alphaproteobacteria bacterium]|nr:Maf family protein [Alphaproteobacteria bacterium]
MSEKQHLILASGSLARRDMLKSAGIAFTVIPAAIDEAAIRDTLTAENEAIDPADVAEILARAKGDAVSADNPGSLVISADQTLSLGGQLFTKPADLDEARDTLLRLRGQQHLLHTAVALVESGEVTWSHIECAHMTMRKFSFGFLSEYLVRAGDEVCQSVGAYQFEGLGMQLFEEVDGDFFSILGLPMLPLLAELRRRGAIAD